jgi:hypothetical protein
LSKQTPLPIKGSIKPKPNKLGEPASHRTTPLLLKNKKRDVQNKRDSQSRKEVQILQEQIKALASEATKYKALASEATKYKGEATKYKGEVTKYKSDSKKYKLLWRKTLARPRFSGDGMAYRSPLESGTPAPSKIKNGVSLPPSHVRQNCKGKKRVYLQNIAKASVGDLTVLSDPSHQAAIDFNQHYMLVLEALYQELLRAKAFFGSTFSFRVKMEFEEKTSKRPETKDAKVTKSYRTLTTFLDPFENTI